MLDNKERMWCHHMVRASIGEKFKSVFPSREELHAQLQFFSRQSPLNQNLGCFVTLKIDGKLRGCIGTIESHVALSEGIEANAIASAFHDPRFSPLQSDEFLKIEIEVSVLGEIKEVIDLDSVVVGTHGLIVKNDGHQGLLLPQVPLEWGWDREQFISHTCMKAGLKGDAWKSKNTKFYYFTAEVF